MTRYFKWNGVSIPFPKTGLEYGYQDISSSDSGRSESALMQKEIIAVKRTINCSWTNIPDSISSLLLTAVKSSTYGNLTYPDPVLGHDVTKNFYTGDPKVVFKRYDLTGIAYWDIEISFIER